MAVEVVLNIFSGKPNPRWLLTDAQVRELDRRLAALENLAGGKTERKLGYRGFLILGEFDFTPSGTTRIFQGIVEYRGGALLDRDRSLERWLLDTSGEVLSPELYDLVLHELGK